MWVCRVACMCVRKYLCVSCQGLETMFLQGAILSHTCSIHFIVLSFFSRLICRNATKHTRLIWLRRSFLIGAVDRAISLVIKCCCQLSQPQPIINNLHFLSNDYCAECRNRIQKKKRIRLEILVTVPLLIVLLLFFTMIQINCRYFQILPRVQDNGLLLGKEQKKWACN